MAAKKKASSRNAAKTAATQADKPERKLSQMAAAIQVLAKAKEPVSCKELVEAMTKRGLWSSPGGKTPEATLYASIITRPEEGGRRPVREGRPRPVHPGRKEGRPP